MQGTNDADAATNTVKRIVENCISFDNQAGYEGVPEYNYLGIQLFNNVAYRNVVNFNMQGDYATSTIIRNNIGYASTTWGNVGWIDAGFAHDHNSWDQSVTVSAADFLSLDTAGVSGARQADGSLPLLDFLHLAESSDLRGTGVAVSGLTLDGAGEAWEDPPSIGAYEYVVPGVATEPIVLTTVATNIGSTTASAGGNVTDDGGATVTARGVCWDTSLNPTTADSHTTNGTGTGAFSSSITGLTKNTEYFYRAYATNSEGTVYGTEYSFTTINYRIVIW